MLTVRDFTGHQAKRKGVGMELEVEATKALPHFKEYWQEHREGSLRGIATEYVSRGPLALGREKTDALRALCTELDKPMWGVIKDSHRTSFHVHHNVMHMTPNQLWTGIHAYWLFEQILFDFCGDERKGNKFCLRLRDAEGVLGTVMHALKNYRHPFGELDNDNIRYAGGNLTAIPRYGSFELRGMNGYINLDDMNTWSTETHNLIMNAAEIYKSPAYLLDDYFRNGARYVLDKLISPAFIIKLIKFNPKRWEDEVRESAETISGIAYFHSWDKYEARLEKEYKKPEPREEEPEEDEVPRPHAVRPPNFLIVDDVARPNNELNAAEIDRMQRFFGQAARGRNGN